MKRFFIILAALPALLLCLCSCGQEIDDGGDKTHDFGDRIIEGERDAVLPLGVWLSYFELKPQSEGMSEAEYKADLAPVMDNLQKLGVTDLFVHVRPSADAIYPSALFPSSAAAVKKQGEKLPFDLFAAILGEAKGRNMRVHAWINPFRVQSAFDPDALASESTAKKWLDSGVPDVKQAAGGLYFDPSSERVRTLIVNGVRELLSGYDIDGIHIDDYFYPTADESFDEAEFAEYRKNGGALERADWRRENVNGLMKELYRTVKSAGEDKIFSVSPAGDIDKNMNELFADVRRWSAEKGYCDLIIPQIYFGFENERMPFEAVADEWLALRSEKVSMWAGLAVYKTEKEDAFAGKGRNEWLQNDDVIARQTVYAAKNGFDGVCLYSANYVNFLKNETKNLYDVLYSYSNEK